MKTSLFRAASVAAVLAAAALSPALAADKAPPLTAAVATNLGAAQKAMAANDSKGAMEAIAKAEAVSGRKPYDDLMINLIKTQAAVGAGDMPAADAAAEAAASSDAIPDSQKVAVYENGLVMALNAQHNDKALIYAKNLEALNITDGRALSFIAKAYYLNNDYPGTIAASQKAIAAAKTTNARAERDIYITMAAAYVANKDQAGARGALEQSIQAFNNPQDWTQLIDVALGTPGLRDLDVIYLGRLLIATNAAITPSQASIIGETAGRLTFYGDAEVMKEHGGTGFPDPAAKANADKAGLAKQIAQAQAAKSGLLAAKIAQAQYSYGMYPDAETSARLAISKGGDPDASEPQMVLAQSLAAQGKYQDAIAAFQTVTGGGAATKRAAELWVMYCNVKLAPPAAATAAK